MGKLAQLDIALPFPIFDLFLPSSAVKFAGSGVKIGCDFAVLLFVSASSQSSPPGYLEFSASIVVCWIPLCCLDIACLALMALVSMAQVTLTSIEQLKAGRRYPGLKEPERPLFQCSRHPEHWMGGRQAGGVPAAGFPWRLLPHQPQRRHLLRCRPQRWRKAPRIGRRQEGKHWGG